MQHLKFLPQKNTLKMQYNQFQKEAAQIHCVHVAISQDPFQACIAEAGSGERMRWLHFLPLSFYLLYFSSSITTTNKNKNKPLLSCWNSTSMTCRVRYLSNNVNIVSPQLTVLTFHSNCDFSNIKRNASYSLHSFSEFHSGKIAL